MAQPIAMLLKVTSRKGNVGFRAIRALIKFRVWRLHGTMARIDWLKRFDDQLYERSFFLTAASKDSDLSDVLDVLADDVSVYIDREIGRQRDREDAIRHDFRRESARKRALLALQRLRPR